ncbi:MAG TPA: hypothetical protein DIC56_08595 [Rhizobium sp.]|nr:hypothetical protein [Rhizobium sp.]
MKSKVHSFRDSALRLLSAFLLTLIAACSQVSPGEVNARAVPARADGDPLATCCQRPEIYPRPLVALLEPFAPAIGRTIAAMVWRPGTLLSHPDATNEIVASLRPLDIIAVSNKGRMSGHTIPGLFSHVAIYLGNEKQLRAAGIWDYPQVRKHREEIRKGYLFVEADQKGVHLSTTELTLDADAIAHLRPKSLSLRRKREALVGFYSRLGMAFDFYFDLETKDCTFCTELANTVMPELRLPVRKVYGRDLILPDEVVANTIRGRTGLAFIRYYRSNKDDWASLGSSVLAQDLKPAWAPPKVTTARAADR